MKENQLGKFSCDSTCMPCLHTHIHTVIYTPYTFTKNKIKFKHHINCMLKCENEIIILLKEKHRFKKSTGLLLKR